MIKANELRVLDEDGLQDKLRELKETLFNLRFQHATGQLDNPMKIKETRRDIARVCTVITEREFSIHLDAFEEALAAPPRETLEEPEELVEAETEAEIEEDLEELAEAEAEVFASEEQLEEEVEEELKDI
jgi:large subunit ribosomal protein L29